MMVIIKNTSNLDLIHKFETDLSVAVLFEEDLMLINMIVNNSNCGSDEIDVLIDRLHRTNWGVFLNNKQPISFFTLLEDEDDVYEEFLINKKFRKVIQKNEFIVAIVTDNTIFVFDQDFDTELFLYTEMIKVDYYKKNKNILKLF